MSDFDRDSLLEEIRSLLPDPVQDDTQLDVDVVLVGVDSGEVVVRNFSTHNTGTKRILLPKASVDDIPTIPGELSPSSRPAFTQTHEAQRSKRWGWSERSGDIAMRLFRDRTVIVELGTLRPLSDLFGRHMVRMNNTPARRQDLAQRLETAGCAVNLAGRDWHSAGDFEGAIQ